MLGNHTLRALPVGFGAPLPRKDQRKRKGGWLAVQQVGLSAELHGGLGQARLGEGVVGAVLRCADLSWLLSQLLSVAGAAQRCCCSRIHE